MCVCVSVCVRVSEGVCVSGDCVLETHPLFVYDRIRSMFIL